MAMAMAQEGAGMFKGGSDSGCSGGQSLGKK